VKTAIDEYIMIVLKRSPKTKTASMSKAAALELKPADESRVSFEIESVKPKAKLDLKSMLDVVLLVTAE